MMSLPMTHASRFNGRGPALATILAVTVFSTGLAEQAVASKLPKGTELRAYLNDECIVSDEPYYLPLAEDQVDKSFSITGIIVGKVAAALVSGLVRVTASGLEEMARQKDMHYVAAYDFNLYRATLFESPEHELTDRLSCITVVAARFEPPSSDCTHRYIPKTIPTNATARAELDATVTREDSSVENILRRANVCVNGVARSVYEGRFQYSEDQTALRLETAGLWVNKLLSTNSKSAKRSVIYTFDLSEPGTSARANTLVSAVVPIGQIKSGLEMDGDGQLARSEWLRVPSMSQQAANAYQRDTSVHQDVYAEIQSLDRSVKRNQRLLEGMERRLPEASENVQAGMRTEMDRIELKVLRLESLLDARRAEYAELPLLEREYMPVTIGVGIIESASEKRALRTLASFLESNSSAIGTAAANAINFERSVDLLGEENANGQAALETARAAYYDAVISVEEERAAGDDEAIDAERRLAEARDNFNRLRAQAGIPAIE